jgi:hypothetical protein
VGPSSEEKSMAGVDGAAGSDAVSAAADAPGGGPSVETSKAGAEAAAGTDAEGGRAEAAPDDAAGGPSDEKSNGAGGAVLAGAPRMSDEKSKGAGCTGGGAAEIAGAHPVGADVLGTGRGPGVAAGDGTGDTGGTRLAKSKAEPLAGVVAGP